jgi:hypothetical protein
VVESAFTLSWGNFWQNSAYSPQEWSMVDEVMLGMKTAPEDIIAACLPDRKGSNRSST